MPAARPATGLKVIEISNAKQPLRWISSFHLLGSKSITDVFALSAAEAARLSMPHLPRNRELWGLAQKLATESGEPVRKHVARIFHQAG